MDQTMQHLTRSQLEEFCRGTLGDVEATRHLDSCEFCRELCEQVKLQLLSADELGTALDAPDTGACKQRLWLESLCKTILPLKLLTQQPPQRPGLLAADSPRPQTADQYSLATMYSEDPELVMRVVRDNAAGKDYLQLIAESPEYYQHVMVRVPSQGREFITDREGRAEIGPVDTAGVQAWDWEIRMPEAIFQLSPLVHTARTADYSAETILETPRHDKLLVRFVGLPSEKQVTVEILELDGEENFSPVKILLVQDGQSESRQVAARQVTPFRLSDQTRRIDLRIFI